MIILAPSTKETYYDTSLAINASPETEAQLFHKGVIAAGIGAIALGKMTPQTLEQISFGLEYNRLSEDAFPIIEEYEANTNARLGQLSCGQLSAEMFILESRAMSLVNPDHLTCVNDKGFAIDLETIGDPELELSSAEGSRNAYGIQAHDYVEPQHLSKVTVHAFEHPLTYEDGHLAGVDFQEYLRFGYEDENGLFVPVGSRAPVD